LRASKWLELLERVVAISSKRISIDLEKKINGGRTGRMDAERKKEGGEMPYAAFHQRFQEIAKQETRLVTILRPGRWDLPPGDYLFLEMYCGKPGCDCRRVFFNVVTIPGWDTVAVIAYGWESPDFYARWFGSNDPRDIHDLKGPILNLCSPQSKHAPALLALAQESLLRDMEYIERLQRHYRMFREAIEGFKHSGGGRLKDGSREGRS
jgi:hypothetical protein